MNKTLVLGIFLALVVMLAACTKVQAPQQPSNTPPSSQQPAAAPSSPTGADATAGDLIGSPQQVTDPADSSLIGGEAPAESP